ncbi:MAG TPA: hypothetical protein VHI98_18490 [Vicinamibacterales bacterium]|jgi:hypothetical protein|nr:hypothetical protein [Vicinamibacterales bacterium]
MPDSRSRTRFVSDRHPAAPFNGVAEFYRQEFIKHQQCIEKQRAYYSERALHDVEAALSRVLAQLDTLCAKENADQVVGKLLRTFDAVTGASAWAAWSDQTPKLH